LSRRFMSTIVKANARYFVKQGWEKPEFLEKIDRWLIDRKDKQLSKKIEAWFRSDAQWTKEISPAMIRHFWYVAPVVWFLTMYMRKLLLIWAKEVEDGHHSGPGQKGN
jgi:hypothetical protein